MLYKVIRNYLSLRKYVNIILIFLSRSFSKNRVSCKKLAFMLIPEREIITFAII